MTPRHGRRLIRCSGLRGTRLYENAVVDENGTWWAMDEQGNLHRFKGVGGDVHWNGSTGDRVPIDFNDIPSYVRRHFKFKP